MWSKRAMFDLGLGEGEAPVRGDSAGARSFLEIGEPGAHPSVSPERGSRTDGVRARIGEPMRMNCSDVVARFTDYLVGVSPPAEQAAIEEHLEHCGNCVRYRNVLVHGAEQEQLVVLAGRAVGQREHDQDERDPAPAHPAHERPGASSSFASGGAKGD